VRSRDNEASSNTRVKRQVQTVRPVLEDSDSDTDSDHAKHVSKKRRKRTIDKAEYLVEKILKDRIESRRQEWFVKWEGYPAARGTWECTENLIENGVVCAALSKYTKDKGLVISS